MTADRDSIEHVGCVDGTVLRVTRHGTEVRLHLGGNVAPLSRDAAQRLAALLHPTGTRPSPAPTTPPPGTSRRMGVGINPSLAALIDEGYLEAGTELVLRHRAREFTATVTATGEVEHGDVLHGSLSAAAKAATGVVAMNGWSAWHVGNDGPISDLRWWLRADHFPGDGHRFSDSYSSEMRMIARWWVEHTLSEGLDPAARDELEIESLLGGNDYAESTLDSYRRHLHNWFALYGRNEASPDDADDDGTGSASSAGMP